MSQLKDYSQVSQKQLFETLETYNLMPEVLEFLKKNPNIVLPLLEITSELEEVFPDYFIDFNSLEKPNNNNLLLLIHAQDKTSQLFRKFNDFKKVWRSEKYDALQEKVILGIKYNGSEYKNPRVAIKELAGKAKGPVDWAAEHDHYLYGTPKRNQ